MRKMPQLNNDETEWNDIQEIPKARINLLNLNTFEFHFKMMQQTVNQCHSISITEESITFW